MAPNPSQLNKKALAGLEALTGLLINEGAADHAPPPQDRRPFMIGWGLMAALHRQACVVMLLHKSNLGHEAAPNRRLMIEYMGQLQWLARDGEAAADSMNKQFQNSHGKLRKAVDEGGVFTYDAEIAAIADTVTAASIPSSSTDTFNATAHLLGSLGNGLKEIWISETQFSHSGIMAARAFFDDSKSGVIHLFDAPRYSSVQDPDEASPFMAFMLLYFGMQAFNELMAGRPWVAELDRIGQDAGLT
ncbi:DUF5677 domain-containing protein [Streptomyces hirsutus]|uniref:hypothetical protein n=1 Tax=Streptomyces hirsutus TaxID=35620 RepID=UPI0036310860